MPAGKTYLVAGVLTFVLGLVLTFPARVAYHWFVPDSVRLGSIEGTVWSGAAREMSAAGLYLRDLEWRLRPLRLITGQLALDLAASPVSGFVETTIAVGIGGDVTVSELNGSLPLQALAPVAHMPGLAGNASLQLTRVRLADGVPVAADGTVAVAGLVAPLVDASAIGGFRAEFLTTENGIVASIEDTDAVFDLAGSLTVSSDRSYVFTGRIAATERTSAKLRQQLRFLGPPDERGRHELRLEGTL